MGAQGLVADAIDMAAAHGVGCPATLGRFGQRAWKHAIASLVPKGNLAHIDLEALEMMCRAYEVWAIAERSIIAREKTEPGSGEYTTAESGYRQISPERVTANRAAAEYRKWCMLFGATPVARIRTAGTAQGDLFDWGGAGAPEESAEQHDPSDPFGPPPTGAPGACH